MSAATLVAGAPGILPGRWDIDAARSTLSVSAGIRGIGSVTGRFTNLAGAVDVTPTDCAVEVQVATASLTTGRPLLDRLLRATGVVDPSRVPSIRFTSTALWPAPGGDWALRGTLRTAVGVAEVALRLPPPATGPDGPTTVRAEGELDPVAAADLLGVARGLLPSAIRLVLAVEARRPRAGEKG